MSLILHGNGDNMGLILGTVMKYVKRKLALSLLKEKGGESQCLDVADKGKRRLIMMIRGGTAPLRIACQRWRGL